MVGIPGLVPGIKPFAGAGACRAMDPGDKRRDDVALEFPVTAQAFSVDEHLGSGGAPASSQRGTGRFFDLRNAGLNSLDW